MSSLELDDAVEPGPRTGSLRRLLDPAFGLFVWAAHFLAVYIGEAIACVLGLGTAGGATQATVMTALVGLTVVAAILVVGHAIWRHRRFHDLPDQRFRMMLTVGSDAIATVAIVWQLFPILLVPVCA